MILTVYHFYPKRIIRMGARLLAFCGLFFIPLWLWTILSQPSFVSFEKKKVEKPQLEALDFSLGLEERMPALPAIELQGEMAFSFDSPRPDMREESKSRMLVRLKKSAESRRVSLPCRIDLEFQRDRLIFAKGPSPFWIELSSLGNAIEVKGFFSTAQGEVLQAGHFTTAAQESPVQTAQEFAEGSPFRILGEAKWWGKDLFKEGAGAERLEIGSQEMIDIKEGEWLVWKEKKWQKDTSPERELPVAHVQSQSPKGLILEGWDGNGHLRLSVPPASGPPFKLKGEEVFSAIRIRSERQISCMLDKQCMILKVGDWALKTGGRWKVLRKEEEKNAFLTGKLFGELFAFDQIGQKQGQKVIQGRLFNPGRTQVVAVELAAQSTQKRSRKGKVQ
jgi:hypothetical protein